MTEQVYYLRNPHTGKVSRSIRMTSAKAAVHNYHLKLNGKRKRWSRPIGKDKFYVPFHCPTPSNDNSYRVIKI